ncbi:3-oxoacyl-[acyl-carrier-protein] reductase isoform X1 [Lagenorhynchus albirostris]|uniref:3-oxoacyl-[acyl-carrier-protein] reductase isoform X1 n=1 Tax=Lagenorhynchus albirostris TaxID=27610 RepID=UPI0028EF3665|nr:3-oxoacyl-[acyl-carrier-protein] reductase isoform X1 [Lagenorhynchus albirostris]
MDRVCAVFGGSRGIGKAVARLMAQRGYRLAIVARNLQGARAAAGDLGGGYRPGAPRLRAANVNRGRCGSEKPSWAPSSPGRSGSPRGARGSACRRNVTDGFTEVITWAAGDHLALSCDVAKEHDVQNTFEEIEKNLGRVNFLVNAAGINRDNLLVRTNAEDMLSQLHTNLLGSMLTCRAAVKTMIKQQTGSIVNVGSVVGVKGSSGQSVYSASKGGLVAFSRALAKEVARKKIRVNVVAPGFVHTDMTKDLKEEHLKKNIPLGRFGDPIDVAHAVVFLLESPYITGHVLVVDGGLQLTM